MKEGFMELQMLSPQTGCLGFAIFGRSNTVAADFCKLIGEGIVHQKVGIVVNNIRNEIAIVMEGISINFSQDKQIIEKISRMLSYGSIKIESYEDGESSGCMVVNR